MTPTDGRVRILVTGFGAFPGTRNNPSAALVQVLAKQRPRLARLGIELELEVLPVVYAAVPSRLTELTQAFRPDAILHFGLATRRKAIAIETRAVNRLSLLRPDASGATAARLQILPGAPHSLPSTFPASEIVVALGRAGIAARLSRNAGKYICNQALYLSLANSDAHRVGFIHVPPLERRSRRRAFVSGPRLTLEELTRAAIIAILAVAQKLRSHCFAPVHEVKRSAPVPALLDHAPLLA